MRRKSACGASIPAPRFIRRHVIRGSVTSNKCANGGGGGGYPVAIKSHSCPKQSLSSGFPQSNPLICSGVGSHQKTRSTTACAYPVQDTDRRGDGGRGTEGAQTWRCTGFPWLSTRAEVAPTGHSLSKTRLAKSCFGQDWNCIQHPIERSLAQADPVIAWPERRSIGTGCQRLVAIVDRSASS